MYASMDISAELITVVMGKGWNDKCDIVDQNSFALPISCHFSTVTCVCEELWQATAVLMS